MKQLFTLIFTILGIYSYALTINIPQDYDSIQSGINHSSNGDVILIQPGIYHESLDFLGKNIIVASLFHTQQDTNYINSTIIEAPEQSENLIKFVTSETRACLLKGFTIRNANNTTSRGGAVFIRYASPTISDCKITNNYSSVAGGAICAENSSAKILNCSFSNNSSNYGGALAIMFNNPSSPFEIIKCNFLNNSANYGAGAHLTASDIIIKDCAFFDNTASNEGGAILALGTNVSLMRSLIANNSAQKGAGIYSMMQTNSSTFKIINSTICNQNASENGGALFLDKGTTALIINSILSFNNPQEIYFNPENVQSKLIINNSIIKNGMNSIITNNNGDISQYSNVMENDPLFVDSLSHNYSLSSSSPAINYGITTFSYNDQVIFNYNPIDYFGNAPDLGAYEYKPSSSEDYPIIQNIKSICYPNPFIHSTNIEYSLKQSEHILLEIYNVKGQKVRTLANNFMHSGKYNIIWNGKDNDNNTCASGIYLYKLSTNNSQQIHKIIMIK